MLVACGDDSGDQGPATTIGSSTTHTTSMSGGSGGTTGGSTHGNQILPGETTEATAQGNG